MFKGHLPKDVRHGQPNPVGLALKGRKRHQNDYLHISDEMSGDGVALQNCSIYVTFITTF